MSDRFQIDLLPSHSLVYPIDELSASFKLLGDRKKGRLSMFRVVVKDGSRMSVGAHQK